MASEAITRNDLTNILNEVLPCTDGVQIYEASWTATSTSSGNARVTGDVILPAGTYIAFLRIPISSQTSALYFGLSMDAVKYGASYINQGIASWVFTLSQETTIYGMAGMSNATNYTYTERGYLRCVRLTKPKATGGTFPLKTLSVSYPFTFSNSQFSNTVPIETITGGVVTVSTLKNVVANIKGGAMFAGIESSGKILLTNITATSGTFTANLLIFYE